MNTPNNNHKITVSCPSGHHVRGGSDLVGKRVKCPKCEAAFVFAPAIPGDSEPATPRTSTLTESGVMRILGDMSPLPAPPENYEAATKACSRCSVRIKESLSVCPHCNCYIGMMPTFLRNMFGENKSARN
jgi:hypothetical protein